MVRKDDLNIEIVDGPWEDRVAWREFVWPIPTILEMSFDDDQGDGK